MHMSSLTAALLLLTTFASQAAQSDPLPAWNNTAAKQGVLDWIANATDPAKGTFIPREKRHVVFDNDGTLWPEAPVTFQLQFAVDEIKRLAPAHPGWKADPIVQATLNNDFQAIAKSGRRGLARLLALTHSDMDSSEFRQRVTTWLSHHRDPRYGCQYDQLGYLPMRQLLDLLRANDFQTWIVSGGGIDFMRVVSEKMYGIAPQQVIGSFAINTFALSQEGSEIQKGMSGAFFNDGASKPVAIHLFMGQRPVAAFGNSDGDVPMLQYTSTNPDYAPLGLLIHHTDGEREYAYDSHPPASGKLVEGLAQAKQRGWVVVDMKNDWNRVFDPALCPGAP
ncbi:HAD family hydrolase [Aeromonas schubertii]|uniref:HAD family hydrolase n=1 Tax=Aeromonas schubertii TaxID=652 RepID=UPI000A4D5FC9|nr:HAD family hydrolase [Aeromonas schubertii]